MKKRIINKFFNQLKKKKRKNVRLKGKVGIKEAKYFWNERLKENRENPFYMLFSLIMEDGGFLGIMAKSLKKMEEKV